MSAPQVARVIIHVDDDGRLAITVDGVAWEPRSGPAFGGEPLPLGRTDVPWALERISGDQGVPLHVVLHDHGETFTDVVIPEDMNTNDPSYSKAQPGNVPNLHRPQLADDSTHLPTDVDGPRPGPGIDGEGFDRGEPVAIALVVARTEADENGEVVFRVPEALRSKVGLVLMYGQDSGMTLHFGPELDPGEPKSTTPTPPVRNVRQHADFGRDFGPATP